MKHADTLALIDALRERGARVVEVNGVRAVFDGPPKAADDLPPEAKAEWEKRLAERRKPKSLEERLLKPLGIKRRTIA